MKAAIGIIGVGATVGIAHNHALGLQKDTRASVTAVYDLDQTRAVDFVRRFAPDAAVCSSLKELLALTDAVDICTPNFTHADYVVQAARAGKAIFVEKPLAITLPDCERACQAAEQAGVFHMVGFVYRFAPHAQALRQLIRSRFTRIYSVSGSYGAQRLADPTLPFEWRMDRTLSGGGALDDFGSHLLDLLFYSCGVKIKKISCLSTISIPERAPGAGGKRLVENDDSSAFSGIGARGELISMLTTRVGMDSIALRISGDGGLVVLSYDEDHLLYYPKNPQGRYSGDRQLLPLPDRSGFQDWFDREMHAFVDGILGLKPEVCSISDALDIQRVLTAAARSAETGDVHTL